MAIYFSLILLLLFYIIFSLKPLFYLASQLFLLIPFISIVSSKGLFAFHPHLSNPEHPAPPASSISLDITGLRGFSYPASDAASSRFPIQSIQPRPPAPSFRPAPSTGKQGAFFKAPMQQDLGLDTQSRAEVAFGDATPP